MVWLGRLGAHKISMVMTKSFCARQSLFNKQNTHTHTLTHTLKSGNYNIWAKWLCWPPFTSQHSTATGSSGNSKKYNKQQLRWPNGIIIRQNNLHCELEWFFLLLLRLYFFFWLDGWQEKWKCLTGKIKYSRSSPWRTWFNLFCWLEN